DAVTYAVEFVVFDHRRRHRIRLVRCMRIGRVVAATQPFLRDKSEGAPLGQHVLPQLQRGHRIWIAAAEPHDGNRWIRHCTTATAGSGGASRSATRSASRVSRFIAHTALDAACAVLVSSRESPWRARGPRTRYLMRRTSRKRCEAP